MTGECEHNGSNDIFNLSSTLTWFSLEAHLIFLSLRDSGYMNRGLSSCGHERSYKSVHFSFWLVEVLSESILYYYTILYYYCAKSGAKNKICFEKRDSFSFQRH